MKNYILDKFSEYLLSENIIIENKNILIVTKGWDKNSVLEWE